jgi:hypothetical protein
MTDVTGREGTASGVFTHLVRGEGQGVRAQLWQAMPEGLAV